MVRSVLESRPIRNVLFSQIPWCPTIIKAFHRAEQQKPEPVELKVVVADLSGQRQPQALVLKEMPRLHLGRVPRGYLRSPFDEIENGPIKPGNGKVTLAVVHDNGFCEVCGEKYAAAEAHRESFGHRQRMGGECWSDFDRIAEEMGNLGICLDP
jgi:hypothetical protein